MISKKQAYIPMLVVAFATIMITGYISTSSLDNLEFASRNHHHDNKSSNTSQRIGQSGHQHQHSFCLSAGANSPITGSCIILHFMQMPMQAEMAQHQIIVVIAELIKE